MYIRLFESGPGFDSIELNIKPCKLPSTGRPMFVDPEMESLGRAICALFTFTDIEEIGIGRERDVRKENKAEK